MTETRQINDIEYKYYTTKNHTRKECRKLAFKKHTEPEKYNRNHPNHPMYQSSSTKNLEPLQSKETKMIQSIGADKQLILETESPHAANGKLQFMIGNGACISLVRYNDFTEQARKKINTQETETINGANGQLEETLGTILLQFHNGPHIYEFKFHVLQATTGFHVPLDGYFGQNLQKSTLANISNKDMKIVFEIWNREMPLEYAYKLLPKTCSILSIQTS